MVYLAAAVAVVGVLCLLDLVLTFGVIRRLREHTKLLSELQGGMSGPLGLVIGEAPGDFTTSTTDGEDLSRPQLAGPTLVGFFSPGCEPCATELPNFVERAKAMADGPGRVLAVITDAGDTGPYRERLDPVAGVVVEPHNGPVQSAFKVVAYPTVYLLDDAGIVAAAGTMIRDLGAAPASDHAAV